MAFVNKDKLISFTGDLIRIPSLSSSEKDAAERTLLEMRNLKYDESYIDEYGNAVGIISGNHPGKTILFDGHLDHVAPEQQDHWKHGPYSADIDSCKMFGRGTADMKGAVAAMVHGAASLIELKQQLHGSIVISASVCEEIAEGIALANVIKKHKPDCVIIGESTNLRLAVCQKGRAEIKVVFKGRTAHSSVPEAGHNAVDSAMWFIDTMNSIEAPAHRILGSTVFVPLHISSKPSPYQSVIPHECTVIYEVRTLPGMTKEGLLENFKAIIESMNQEDSNIQAEVSYVEEKFSTYTGKEFLFSKFIPPWETEVTNEYVIKAMGGLKIAGLKTKVSGYRFCTNGSMSAVGYGIPTVGFGPGTEEQAHIIDEFIATDDLVKAAEGYRGIAHSLLYG